MALRRRGWCLLCLCLETVDSAAPTEGASQEQWSSHSSQVSEDWESLWRTLLSCLRNSRLGWGRVGGALACIFNKFLGDSGACRSWECILSTSDRRWETQGGFVNWGRREEGENRTLYLSCPIQERKHLMKDSVVTLPRPHIYPQFHFSMVSVTWVHDLKIWNRKS